MNALSEFPKIGSFKHLLWMIKENKYEYPKDNEDDLGFDGYHPWNFSFRMFIAWLFKLECPYCDSDGMSGYYEREACNYCDGFHLQWNDLIKNRWNNFWHDRGYEERIYYEWRTSN